LIYVNGSKCLGARCAGPRRGEQMRRRTASRLILTIDVRQRLSVDIADDEEAIA
jgi:hypothetical protein